MDINDLFDGIAEAFRQYQAEMAEQAQASTNPGFTGLEPERESEKSEKIMPPEKGIEQDFPKRE
ncbi:MAG: hypothetical protein HKM93_15980 [Desulfobacteraceae bacterium]|nr:hypothetical protein [Desulfobacteraceae bacterium]